MLGVIACASPYDPRAGLASSRTSQMMFGRGAWARADGARAQATTTTHVRETTIRRAHMPRIIRSQPVGSILGRMIRVVAAAVASAAVGLAVQPQMSRPQGTRFDSDLAFLQQHTKVIVLTEPAGAAKVVVAPEYQGRVMTSTTGGAAALSFGWIGRAAIASGKRVMGDLANAATRVQ